MLLHDATYAVELGFTPPTLAIADDEHPGLLRAGPRVGAPYNGDTIELHACAATDCAHEGVAQPDLLTFGFDRVDLTELEPLQRACADTLTAGTIDDATATIIREQLTGARLRCASGLTVTVQYVADEGLIMRAAGPNRLSVVGPRSRGMNDHGAAASVHADQDVFGTPLTQLMEGRAPELFRHDSPDGRNDEGSLLLVNLWIPLQQIVQPLVLGDGRSIDRARHQLRYGLATSSFLERDEDQVINDIWTFLHDDAQQWYFSSEMDHRSAYLFNTLSTPHGAGVVPGEDVAEQCYMMLESAEAAVVSGDPEQLITAVAGAPSLQVPTRTTPALHEAIARMIELLAEARADAASVCGERAAEWLSASRAARASVVRMSLELRLVVSLGG